MEKIGLIDKLDSLVSNVVAVRSKCERCGKTYKLESHHIFYRRFMATRFDLDNLILLCLDCHKFAHSYKKKFTEWVKKYLGKEKYEALKEKHNQVTKYTIEDLFTKLKLLQELK